ncbi:hypothetical protein Rrhod_3213 [Rhodococcus rhodnii LMG 5362]|uniref:2-oxoadipate dioxygenase/decarboxylase n=1 Tax=Rhodococcus rhodnii LMG 5362 TaxID=1273125 RepID=R7WJH0_9NOCA|nr:hypothetical protein Rrhod_3213 [Rhodococcus rhodnii LMG 5362]
MPQSRLRAAFAAALSRMYGREVPAYTTLVDVTAEVNRDHARNHPRDAERLGSLERVTAERHGAIRVGSETELAHVAAVFAGFGMYPVGYYDLRTASTPIPVVSTAFRPTSPAELARNPFRVFTSMLTTGDGRFFDADLARRVRRFVAARRLFPDELLALAHRADREAGLPDADSRRFVELATAAFALSREPIDRGWYRELEAVSPVAADIAGVTSTHINHLTPRVLDIDELYRRMTDRGIAMIDRIQGPPRWAGPDVLLRQTSFRALAEPRAFRDADGTVSEGPVRVRFGEVEARGIALTPRGRARYDALADSPAETWEHEFPSTERELDEQGLAYFESVRDADGAVRRVPIVYEDFLPASAAGIFRSNLDDPAAPRDDRDSPDTARDRYTAEHLAGAIDRPVHDPFTLYDQQSRTRSERITP